MLASNCMNKDMWCFECPDKHKCDMYNDDPHAREEVHGGCLVSSQ